MVFCGVGGMSVSAGDQIMLGWEGWGEQKIFYTKKTFFPKIPPPHNWIRYDRKNIHYKDIMSTTPLIKLSADDACHQAIFV